MKSILVVEDDVFISELVSDKLIKSNFSVETTNSGEKAIEHIKNNRPDLMILDLDIVGMHGFEVLRTIRSDSEMKTLPVIVFSNNDEPDAREKCAALDTPDFYLKFETDLSVLIDCINQKLA
jgi:CheY-like chemotaxis protein